MSEIATKPLRIFDLHCDTLDALCMNDASAFVSLPSIPAGSDMVGNPLQLAAERMATAGQWCQCYAIWVPDDLAGTGLTAHEFYDRVAAYYHGQLAAHPSELHGIRDGRTIEGVLAQGGVGCMLTVENGSPLEDGMEVLDQMHADGVKMMTLVWNGQNRIASGNDTQDGMSAFGRSVVRRMERLKMVVDVSHLNDAGFKDLLACSERPFVATHSNSRAICAHPRNLTDYQFKAIADRGGLVGINYYRAFVSERFDLDHGEPGPGRPEVSFDDLSYHIDHMLELDGQGTIALGSDFDGSETPSWLSGAQDLPRFYELIAGRFGADVADDMFFNNAARFFARNEEL